MEHDEWRRRMDAWEKRIIELERLGYGHVRSAKKRAQDEARERAVAKFRLFARRPKRQKAP